MPEESERLISDILESGRRAAADAQETMSQLTASADSLNSKQKELNQAMQANVSAIQNIISAGRAAMMESSSLTAQMVAGTNAYGTSLKIAAQEAAKAQKTQTDLQKNMTKMEGAIRGTGGTTKRSLKNIIQAYEGASVVTLANATSVKALGNAYLQLGRFTNASTATHQAYADSVNKAKEAIDVLSPKLGLKFAKAAAASSSKAGQLATTVSAISPKFAKMTANFAKMSPLAVIVGFIANAIHGAIKGGVDVTKQLLGTMTGMRVSILQSTHVFSAMAAASGILGATTEEAQAGLKATTDAYAINTFTLKQNAGAQMEYIKNVAIASGVTIALGKVMGLNVESTKALMVSLIRMGTPADLMNKAFKKTAESSKASLLTMNDFIIAMGNLAPASGLVVDATKSAQDMMVSFGVALRNATDPISEMIKSKGRMLEFSNAMKEFTATIGKMDVGTILAAGAAMGELGGGGDRSILEAAAMADRTEAMVGLLMKINDSARSTSGGIDAMGFFLQSQGMSLNQSVVIANLIKDAAQGIFNGQQVGVEDANKAAADQMKQLELTAATSAGLKDPLQYIATLLERLIQLFISGMTGGGLGMVGSVFRATMGGTAPRRIT